MSFSNPEDRYRCPKCRLADRVEKAEVSQRVNVPQPPSIGTPLVYESPWGCFSVGLVLLAAAALVYFVYALITITPEQRAHPTIGGILVYLTIIGLGVFISIHHVLQAKTRREEVARYNAVLEVRNEAERKRYKHEQEIYDQLYYCGRDNVVFILGKPETGTPASEVEYLYKSL